MGTLMNGFRKSSRLTRVLLVAAALAVGGTSVRATQTAGQTPADRLLQSARNKEVVEGKLDEAIRIYQQVLAQYKIDRPAAAQALARMAGCYEKLGAAQTDEARKAYEQLVRDYGDQKELVAQAQARLSALGGAAAGGPFASRSLDALIKSDYTSVSVSPNGRSVAYVRSNAAGGQTLGVRDFASGAERALAQAKDKSDLIWHVLWSPDSSRIVYWIAAGAAQEGRVVTVAQGETQTFHRTDHLFGAARWSPDGRRLAFVVGKFVASVGGADANPSRMEIELRLVTVGSPDSPVVATIPVSDGLPTVSLVWSPDGRRLAWVAPPAANAQSVEIRVMAVASREGRSLDVPQPATVSRTTLAAWTPKDELFFSQSVPGGNDFFLIPAGGGQARKICEGRGNSGGDGCGALSPDATLIVTRKNVEGGGRVVLRDVITGAEHPLTTASVLENPVGGFSPDGRLIAFRSHRDGKWGVYVAPVSQAPVARPILVTPLESSADSPSAWWTSGGLFVRVAHNQTNVYRVGMDPKTGLTTGAPQRLTQDTPSNSSPMVSPDGRRIAYKVDNASNSAIAVIDATGARERLVAGDVPNAVMRNIDLLGWVSIDEILLAEPTARAGRQPGFKTLNVRSGEWKDWRPFPADLQLNDRMVLSHLWYLPGQQDVLYNPMADGKRQMGRFRSPGGIDINGVKDMVWGAVSADSRYLLYAYSSDLPGKSGPNNPYLTGLRLKPLDGRPERELTRVQVAAGADEVVPKCFSPDGRFVLYFDQTGSPRIIDVETGESRPFVEQRKGDISFPVYSTDASWSPDGSFIALTGSTSRTEWKAFNGVTYDAVAKVLKRGEKGVHPR